jgi:hypothetical protein
VRKDFIFNWTHPEIHSQTDLVQQRVKRIYIQDKKLVIKKLNFFLHRIVLFFVIFF